jgi:hypothetical protein
MVGGVKQNGYMYGSINSWHVYHNKRFEIFSLCNSNLSDQMAATAAVDSMTSVLTLPFRYR